MREHKGHFQGVRRALAASIVALLAAAPALAAEASQPAASRYVPTMADYLAVYDALQNYRAAACGQITRGVTQDV